MSTLDNEEREADVLLKPYFGRDNGIYSDKALRRQDRSHEKLLKRVGPEAFTDSPDLEYRRICEQGIVRAAQRAGFDEQDVRILRKHLAGQSETEIGHLYGMTQQAVSDRIVVICQTLEDPVHWQGRRDSDRDIWELLSEIFHLPYETIKAYCFSRIAVPKSPKKRTTKCRAKNIFLASKLGKKAEKSP